MKYLVRDENGELMRIVGRREEAKQIVNMRDGWTFTVFRPVKFDLFSLGEALI